MRGALAAVAVVLAGPAVSRAQVSPPPRAEAPAPALAEDDRARIAEAMRVSRLAGDSLWPEWSEVPFALLLVTPETEFLIGHPRPTPDFTPLGSDPALGAEVLHRPRVFDPNLLATFPAVGGFPTIVVGTPEATDKGATGWVLSVLHERFHQLQMSQDDYFEDVDELGLARGDTTGRWMLDFPFPYDDAIVRGRFVDLQSRLLRALELAGTPDFDNRVRAYHAARERVLAALRDDDYRYLQFQLWQEGVARYTELRLAELAARHGDADSTFRTLPGYEPYRDAGGRLRREILEGLQTSTLAADRRVALYPLGAATALLLDLVAPEWREEYFDEPFALDAYF